MNLGHLCWRVLQLHDKRNEIHVCPLFALPAAGCSTDWALVFEELSADITMSPSILLGFCAGVSSSSVVSAYNLVMVLECHLGSFSYVIVPISSFSFFFLASAQSSSHLQTPAPSPYR